MIKVILEVLVVIQGGAILEASAAVHISHRSHSYSDSSRRFTLVALVNYDSVYIFGSFKELTKS